MSKKYIYDEIKLSYFARFYGKEKQISQLDEEMAELTIATHKLLRDKTKDTSNLKEEIADVENMLYQIKLLYNINQLDINLIKKEKIDRQYNRILEELRE